MMKLKTKSHPLRTIETVKVTIEKEGVSMNTKEQIYQYLVFETQILLDHDFSLLTTTVISESLHLSRSLVSQYLNELFQEGLLIKVSSRPVYYFDKHEFEKRYRVQNVSREYLSVKALMDEIQSSEGYDSFQDLIGFDGSLSHIVQQIKSALLYPGRGLPIVLFGKRGSGKTYLSRMIHKFCVEHDLIQTGQSVYHLKFIDPQCDYELLLFGDETQSGLLEQKDIGVLYLEHADRMRPDIQYQVSNVIKDGYYTKDRKVVKVHCRLVFGTSYNPEDAFDYSLLQSLPIICKIPHFDQRGTQEKEHFILKFFKQEQQKLGLKIFISYKLLEALLQLKFDEDIHELKKCITRICATALESAQQGVMHCHLYHLPEDKLNYTISNEQDMKQLIEIDTYVIHESTDKIVHLFKNILKAFNSFQSNQISYREMLAQDFESMRNYYDLMIFDQSYSLQKVYGLEKIIDDVLEDVKQKNKINIPSNCSFVLSRVLLSSSHEKIKLDRWTYKHRNDINALLEFLKEEMYDIFMISNEISKMVYQALELKLNDFNLIFLILNIYFYNDNIKHKDTAAVIVSHGYSTASSIADAANQLLEEHIFDAFDMPLDSSSEEIIMKVNDYIALNPYYKNLILLVDMGSLELIGDRILKDLNVGVINNSSTAIALHIGSMVRQEYPLEEILAKASKQAVTKYKILNRAEKTKAMVFVSDAGVSVADRMVNLFKQSLPKSIDLRFIRYDFKELLTNGLKDPLFDKFEVMLMVKPHSLPLDSIRSVSLEDIVSFKDISIVDKALEDYLDADEIEVFNRNLLKNFSLQNVMQNLTILNANKLLNFVSDSTSHLERKMQKTFQSKTIVGIYIHVCFLIERLVTKTAIDDYNDVKRFEKDHQAFIRDVNDSFGPMLEHYNVMLPVSEIALLYDYIENDKNREHGEDDSF